MSKPRHCGVCVQTKGGSIVWFSFERWFDISKYMRDKYFLRAWRYDKMIWVNKCVEVV